ncbi:MAG: DUF58 domain-containing protein [Symbiobacteriia bacterium]
MLPTWRTVSLVALASFVPMALPAGATIPAWWVLMGGLLLLFLLDWAVAWRTPVQAMRRPVPLLVLGRPETVEIELGNPGRRPLRLAWRDSGDAPLALSSEMKPAHLGPAERLTVTYPLTAQERGSWRLGDLYLRRRGPLGLAWHQWRAPASQTVKVYPDLKALARHGSLLLATRQATSGLRRARHRGLGMEFESLREYTQGDSFRSINWHATARRGKLVTNVYQSERGQTIMLLVDAGRLLVPKAGDRSRLDFTVEAALALATLGLKFDDRVGLLAFADQPLAYVAPERGKNQLYRLAEALYRLKPRLVEADYAMAMQTLRSKVRRRSLVCLFSDLLDAAASRYVLGQMERLSPRHLPLFVALRDPSVVAMAEQPVTAALDAYSRAMAARHLERRETALAALRARGGLALHVLPQDLNAAVLNQYLEVKERALL